MNTCAATDLELRCDFGRWLRYRMAEAPGQIGDLARALTRHYFSWSVFNYPPEDWPRVIRERGYAGVDNGVLLRAWEDYVQNHIERRGD